MINHVGHKTTFYDETQRRLSPAVITFASLSSVFELKGKVYATFVQSDDTVWALQFDSRSHVEVWAESCQRDPKLTRALFEKRLAK